MAEQLVAYPLTFNPLLVSTVWGGQKLAAAYGKPPQEEPTGESWEVSAVQGRESVVRNGPLAGQRLDQLIERFGSSLLGEEVARRHGLNFPLLLKLIDASEDLSVQVHPNEEQARQLGGGAHSKSEAWLILGTEPGARLVHGVKPGLTRPELERLVREDRLESCLRYVEVHPGDVVPVPPGTLHAIGRGVLLLELQQSSDTTYRFYDYGRLGLDGKPRPLHIDKALAVVRLDNLPPTATPQPLPGPGLRELLYRGQAVEMQRWRFDAPVPFATDASRFWLITVLEGGATLRSDSPEPAVALTKGDSALLPPSLALELVPDEQALVFLGAPPLPSPG